jgi:predicted enzyme related to lactoylglutathione lyase
MEEEPTGFLQRSSGAGRHGAAVTPAFREQGTGRIVAPECEYGAAAALGRQRGMTFEEPVHAVVVGIDASVARTAVTSWRGYRMRGYAERMEIDCVIVDCVDPARLAEFWGEVLGRGVDRRVGPYVFLERRRGLALGFQRVDGPKTGKNRLHLDIEAADPLAEASRVEALGGRRAEGFEAGGFLVMADPEGNEFCIVPPGPLEMDGQGRVSYL